ncbi:MAG: hypothetical protein AVDCRST_MAG11-381, partial [uncultured Gemmatimonadaceae bacterium]
VRLAVPRRLQLRREPVDLGRRHPAVRAQRQRLPL